jgi:hypothetical protein
VRRVGRAGSGAVKSAALAGVGKGFPFMSSVVKKRRKKMRKHKHKKLMSRNRHKKKK